jgi:phage gp29-like protein
VARKKTLRSAGATRATSQRAPAKALPKEPSADAGSALADPSVWETFQRMGGGITPADILPIMRAADGGDPSRLIDLTNELRQKVGHLQSTLFTREAALAKLEWEITLPGASGKPRLGKGGKARRASPGESQRRFIEDTFRALDAPSPDSALSSLRGLFADLSGGTVDGHAVSEALHTRDKRGRLIPRGFKKHPARRFGYDFTGKFPSDRLILRDSTTRNVPVDFRSDFPFRFIVSQPRVNGDVPSREGLGRVLVWPSLFWNWALSDYLKLAELAWKPWRLAKILKNASKDEIRKAQAALQSLVTNGCATHSENVEILLKWADGAKTGSSGHGDLLARLAAEISKAALGQTLTTEQGAVGSQALGNVHNDVRKDHLEFDAQHLASVITRDLIRPLIELNFGPGAPIPIFRFVTEDATDFKAFAEALKVLVKDIGMKIPKAWAHDQLGVPVPQEGEEILGEDAPDEEPEGEKPPPSPEGDEPEPANDDEADEESEDEAA